MEIEITAMIAITIIISWLSWYLELMTTNGNNSQDANLGKNWLILLKHLYLRINDTGNTLSVSRACAPNIPSSLLLRIFLFNTSCCNSGHSYKHRLQLYTMWELCKNKKLIFIFKTQFSNLFYFCYKTLLLVEVHDFWLTGSSSKV